MATLIDPPTSSLVELPHQPDDGVPCPECGIYFANRTSMLCHMSKRHKHHEARPVNQAERPFDKHTDAKGGLPQCSHCHTKLCDFSSLRKHINKRRCRVLFPVHPQPQMLLTNPDPPQASNPTKTENPCLRTGHAHPPLEASPAVTPEMIGIASSSSETKPEAALDATGRQGMGMAEQQKEEQRDEVRSHPTPRSTCSTFAGPECKIYWQCTPRMQPSTCRIVNGCGSTVPYAPNGLLVTAKLNSTIGSHTKLSLACTLRRLAV